MLCLKYLIKFLNMCKVRHAGLMNAEDFLPGGPRPNSEIDILTQSFLAFACFCIPALIKHPCPSLGSITIVLRGQFHLTVLCFMVLKIIPARCQPLLVKTMGSYFAKIIRDTNALTDRKMSWNVCLPFQAKYMFQNMVIMPLVVKQI